MSNNPSALGVIQPSARRPMSGANGALDVGTDNEVKDPW
jgi:hypothetical protein